MRCGACGSRDIDIKNVRGRYFPYKDYEAVLILVNFYLNVCQDCENVLLMRGDAAKLDAAIEESLNGRTRMTDDEKQLHKDARKAVMDFISEDPENNLLKRDAFLLGYYAGREAGGWTTLPESVLPGYDD